MNATEVDYGDEPQTSDSDSLKSLISHGERMDELETRIIPEIEAQLKKATEELRELKAVTVPSLMTSLRMMEIKLSSGSAIVMRNVVRATLPAQGSIQNAKTQEERELLQHRLEEGISWLKEEGGEAIIKNVVTVEVGKGKDNEAGKIIEFAESNGFRANKATTVHPQSLSSFIKEKMQHGAAVPMDVFGVYAGSEASVNRPRKFGNA